MLISDNLRIALLEQWVEEKENSFSYLYIGSWLKNFGLDNLGKYFVDASKEEDGHAQSIIDLLTDLNVQVELLPIANMGFLISSISDIADKFMAREIQTTDSLQEIKELSSDGETGNPIVEEHIRRMISQQQSEIEEATTFKDKANILKEWWQVVLWDLSLK